MDIEREMIIKKLAEILPSEETQAFLNENLNENWKNSEQSEKLRKEGNDLYAKAKNALQMEEIYKLYSQSIAFAENDSEELASAYGNRSAILFRMKKYNECIANIDFAIKINNSDKFKIKLLCRKIACINLQGLATNEEIFLEVESLISTMKDTDKEKYRNEFEKSKIIKVTKVDKSEEKQIPKHVKILKKKENENPFNSVSIKCSEKYGRYLVANKDFHAGEIVFIEKPYVKVAILQKSHMYCGHCLASSWATIPCNYCNWCMFCSEECKKTSWEQYHNVECIVMSKLIKKYGKMTHNEHRTIRSLLLGIKDSGSIQNLKIQLESIDTCTDQTFKGFKSDGSYKSMGFKSIYTLNDYVNLSELPTYTTSSVLILLSLIKFTSLFETSLECNFQNLLVNDEVLFIGSLLLKLHKINIRNYQYLRGKDLQKCKLKMLCSITSQCCKSGVSTAAIISLIKNNCHPQAIVVNNKQSELILCSLRPIKKDSQIFLTYCFNFFETQKFTRETIFKYKFNFTCDCEACEQNWPVLQEPTFIAALTRLWSPYSPYRLRSAIDIYHERINNSIIVPLLESHPTADCTLNTIATLRKAIAEAYEDLKHPSIALFKLERSMQVALEKLYKNC